MKNTNEINATMEELKSYLEMRDELDAQIDSLKDEIKEYMTETGTDEVINTETGTKCVWREIVNSRFDSTAFKKAYAELYKAYTKRTTNMRFTVNW